MNKALEAFHRLVDKIPLKNPNPHKVGYTDRDGFIDFCTVEAALTSQTWQDAYEEERRKFQQETLRTSDLSAMLRKILERLHETGCRAEEWSRKCRTCDLMIEAEALLKRPINLPNPPQEKE